MVAVAIGLCEPLVRVGIDRREYSMIINNNVIRNCGNNNNNSISGGDHRTSASKRERQFLHAILMVIALRCPMSSTFSSHRSLHIAFQSQVIIICFSFAQCTKRVETLVSSPRYAKKLFIRFLACAPNGEPPTCPEIRSHFDKNETNFY